MVDVMIIRDPGWPRPVEIVKVLLGFEPLY